MIVSAKNKKDGAKSAAKSGKAKTKSKSKVLSERKKEKNRNSKPAFAEVHLGADQLPEKWGDFAAGLSSSPTLKSLLKSDQKSYPFLLWGIASDDISLATRRFAEQCRSKKKLNKQENLSQFNQRLLEASAFNPADEPTLDQAVTLLAICHAFPKLVSRIPADLAQSLFATLVDFAKQSRRRNLPSSTIVYQLLAGELPLTMSFVFPRVTACSNMANMAAESLRIGLSELLDRNGMPKASVLQQVQILAACWVRSHAICNHLDLKLFSGDAETEFVYFLAQLFRLVRADGSVVFTPLDQFGYPPVLFDSILQITDDPQVHELARAVLATPGAKRNKQSRLLPLPSGYSECSEVAVMQSGWKHDDVKLVVDFSAGVTDVELSREDTLLSGPWTLSLTSEGLELVAQSNWCVVCWHTDDDCDYLELEIHFEQGIKVQRQILLGHDEQFLFLADAVLYNRDHTVVYQSSLPIAQAMQAQQAKETREVFIEGKQKLAAVLPIGLPEWKIANSIGAFGPQEMITDNQQEGSTANVLESTYALSSSTYIPLFIDTDPRRILRPLTWRQLTVASSLQIEPADQAVGYRVQVDDSQWLFYRSLTEAKSRTVLGQNLFCDFFAAEFEVDGEATEILTVT